MDGRSFSFSTASFGRKPSLARQSKVITKRCGRLSKNIVISTTHPFYQMWKLLSIIAAFVSSFEYINNAAFGNLKTDSEAKQFSNRSLGY